MAKHEYYVVQGKTLDNVAETMKTVLGVDKDTPIRFDEITNNEKAEQVTENVDAQAKVIEQIKTALNGKSSIGVKEIMDIIDQSGVLGTTDGTVQEKIEQLIYKAEDESLWYNQFKTNGLRNIYGYCNLFENYSDTRLPRIDVSNFEAMYRFCYNAKQLERIDFYLDCGKVTGQLRQAFTNTINLKYMKGINTSSTKDVREFLQNSGIEEIEIPFNFSNVTLCDNAFKCSFLRKILFENETIKVSIAIPSQVLSDESIQSIIDGLATVETAQTLTLSATVKAKLTETQLATITNKNWNLA